MKLLKSSVFLFALVSVFACGKGEQTSTNEEENEREIAIESLPQAIKDKIARDYPEAKLIEADEISLENGKKSYDVEIKSNGKISELMYAEDGNFLGEEIDDEYDDDEEDED